MSDEKPFVYDGQWTGGDGCTYTYGKVVKKPCAACRKDFEWDGNKYKTKCKPCFVKTVRVCTACKKKNLKADAPSYQMICTTCWLAQKALTHKVCPRCPPDRATHLRCLLDKEMCSECELRCTPVIPSVEQEGEMARE
jgi:hypothetical protein